MAIERYQYCLLIKQNVDRYTLNKFLNVCQDKTWYMYKILLRKYLKNLSLNIEKDRTKPVYPNSVEVYPYSFGLWT
jgi:hypothetical protein